MTTISKSKSQSTSNSNFGPFLPIQKSAPDRCSPALIAEPLNNSIASFAVFWSYYLNRSLCIRPGTCCIRVPPFQSKEKTCTPTVFRVFRNGLLSLQQETILHCVQQPTPSIRHHQPNPTFPAIHICCRCPWSLRHRTQRRSQESHWRRLQVGFCSSCRRTFSRHMLSLRVAQGKELVGIRLGSRAFVCLSQSEAVVE